MCYAPQLVVCETQLRIAFCESGWGRDLYNETAVWVGGVEQHAVGWYGMLVPLHAHHWPTGVAPAGSLDGDTAAFFSLVAEQGLSPWPWGWYDLYC